MHNPIQTRWFRIVLSIIILLSVVWTVESLAQDYFVPLKETLSHWPKDKFTLPKVGGKDLLDRVGLQDLCYRRVSVHPHYSEHRSSV